MKKVKSKVCKTINEIEDKKALKKKLYENKEWYTIRALLGNT